MRIWKYEVPINDHFTLSLPVGAEPLTVQVQAGDPQMWILLDETETIYTDRKFRVAGTGHPIQEPRESLHYVSTFQLAGGQLIFHVFEVISSEHIDRV